jgi:hypothetical protein
MWRPSGAESGLVGRSECPKNLMSLEQRRHSDEFTGSLLPGRHGETSTHFDLSN